MIRVSAVMALALYIHFLYTFLGFILASLIFSSIDSLKPWDKKIGDPHSYTALADSQPYVLFVRIIHISLPRGVGLFSGSAGFLLGRLFQVLLE
jgi:ABC-type uncharacterized transport system permease subunit